MQGKNRDCSDVLELTTDRLRVGLLPDVGGGIAHFDWLGYGGPIPLMRQALCGSALARDGSIDAAHAPTDPNTLACYPLIPWSNRITGGGFSHDGIRIDLARNRADDDYPIHGTGWQRAWQVDSHQPDAAVFSLHDTVEGGYAYGARMAYHLEHDTLRVELSVTNHGPSALPFGLGLHPFFPRHGSVQLHAPARSVWRNDERNLIPVARDAVPPAWDFSSDRPLPAGGLNNAFQGWTGAARITWPQQRLCLDVTSDVDTYVLYVPADESFFCFEPVDHPVNAVNQPGGAAAHGMSVLAPGESLARSFAFRVSEKG
ncbi:aldose 1-epimerase [Luteibacter sp.]|uniref:aldose 1-epimerase n=1 Tax=Luteibacter sp. TaxID=1886636 RepID=UPI003F800A30